MGNAMTQRLLQADFAVTVYNRTPNKADSLVALGANRAGSIADAVKQADVVISCLLNDEALQNNTTGEGGIAQNLKPGGIHISTATVLPDTAEAMQHYHQQHGNHYVSASVLGVPKVALEGMLTCFCACSPDLLPRIEPALNTFAKRVVHLGDQAKAPLVMKICMNYSLITSIELIGELYAFAENSGLDPELVQHGLHDIYAHPAFKLYVDKIKQRDFDNVNFDMKGGLKDVNLFQHAFNDAGVTPHIADIVKSRITAALDAGMEDKDWSAMSDIVRRDAGL